MNAEAIAGRTDIAPAFAGWLKTGHDLLTQRNEIEWRLADWINDGAAQFGSQLDFAFLAADLGIAPRELRHAARVAVTFPAHLRDPKLTFQHHECVASLPAPEALSVLKAARDQKWDDRQTRVEAVKRKAMISQPVLIDDDWEHHELMAITRAWNRARSSVRQEFVELAAESHLGVIDA